MKRLMFILLASISITAYGQKLVVTPNGLRNADDNEKNFIVLNLPEMTAQQLYEKTIKYINKNYKNPEEVIKGKTENEYLKFETYNPSLLFIKNGGLKQFFSAQYTTELSFKDGKIKYEIIELKMNHTQNNMTLYLTGGGLDWAIYNKKGELKREQAKIDIETYFNGQITDFINFLNGKTEENNW